MSEHRGFRLLTMASVLQKVLALLFFTFISNVLGVERTGDFAWAMAYTTIFGFFVDFGLTPAITRHVAGAIQRDGAYFQWLAASWNFRALASVFSYGLAIGFYLMQPLLAGIGLSFLPFSEQRLGFILLSGLIMVGDNFIVWANAVWRGARALEYEAKAMLMYQVVVITIGGVLLYMTRNVTTLLFMYALASVSTAIYLHIQLWRHGWWQPLRAWGGAVIMKVLRENSSLIMYGGLIRMYNYLDSLLVDSLAGVYQLGLYGLGNKVLLSLQFLPSTFAARFYALFARDFRSGDMAGVRAKFEEFLFLAAVLGSGVGVMGFFGAETLVTVAFPAFKEAIPMIQILCMAIPATFMNFPLGSLLNATHRSSSAVRNLFIVLLINIGADIFLIPHYQGIAAAWSSMVSNWLFVILNATVAAEVLREERSKTSFIRASWGSLIAGTVGVILVGVVASRLLPSIVAVTLVGVAWASVAGLSGWWHPFRDAFFSKSEHV